MDQVYVIRHKVLVEGLGIRRVAREMGVSRNTVRRYLTVPEPVRRVSKARERPVLEGVASQLEELVEQWAPRTTAKQRITAARLHREIVARGEKVGLTLVQDWLRERRRRQSETYVPLVHRVGDEAQVDFFDVTVEVNGERRRAWMFVMRLMYSGRDFAWIYEWADQVSFLDGHVKAFEHFGAVPHRLIYDNLSSAVRRVVLPERELTVRFVALASHYLFEPCFTRPGTGHDKGGVESRGKGIRLQELVPIPSGESLRAISEKLLTRLEQVSRQRRDQQGRSIAERFEQERGVMLPLAAVAYEPRKVVLCSVSSRALATIDGAVYSVPSHWKRLDAKAYVGPEDIRFEARGEEMLAERKRFGEKRILYRHYLPELAQKPQALRQVAAELLSELGEPYGSLWRLLVDSHGPREAARVFARVLGAVVDHGEDVVAKAVKAALGSNRSDLLELGRLIIQPKPLRTSVPQSLAGYEIEAASASTYDSLLSVSSADE
jgi:transposase